MLTSRRTSRSNAGWWAGRPLARLVAVVIIATGWPLLASLAASGQPSSTETTQPPETTTPPTTAPATTAPPTTAPSTTAASTTGPSTTGPSTTLSAEQQQERDRAVANLNVARADDRVIAEQLREITDLANQTIAEIEEWEHRLEQAQNLAASSASQLEEKGAEQAETEAQLVVQAIEDFKARSVGDFPSLLTNASTTEALRQNQLLREANPSLADDLEDLRATVEQQQDANAQAERAEREARLAQRELEVQLERLQAQQTVQIELKNEAERRIDEWAGELTAYAQEDAAVQNLIGQSAETVNTAVANPTNPSALGFQWPIDAPVTSPYGYRIHPVYGTRRLHAGVDLGAPRGTPIASANDGVVIFAGTQGGYGRTVIVDHGGGITTLYAHMTEWNASEGQQLSRGDIVGFVGATGTATGNHLHFEVRVNGGAVNPRNYLP